MKQNIKDISDFQREVDDDILKRKKIRKFFVDPKGLHCIMLAEHEVYYNNWYSERVF